MKIAIVGASGFVGQQLTQYLLATSSHRLVLFSHKASKLDYKAADERRLTHVDGNVLQTADIQTALMSCDMAVYLVHLMGSAQNGNDFGSLEKQAAHNFTAAVQANEVQRVVYVGGMGDDTSALTKHLESRATTGSIIRAEVPQLIELRTPMIIGAGGAGFEVLAGLVRKLPILPVPKWAKATTQPITVNDVVRYVAAALKLKTSEHVTVDIGGPEKLSYVQVAERYAAYRHKRLRTVTVPFVPKSLIKFVLRRFKSNAHALTVADMLESAGFTTTIDSQAQRVFPAIKPETIENAFGPD